MVRFFFLLLVALLPLASCRKAPEEEGSQAIQESPVPSQAVLDLASLIDSERLDGLKWWQRVENDDESFF